MKALVLLLAFAATLLAGSERIYVANTGGADISVIDSHELGDLRPAHRMKNQVRFIQNGIEVVRAQLRGERLPQKSSKTPGARLGWI